MADLIKVCKNQVAKDLGYRDWKDMDFAFSGRIPSIHLNKVIRMYGEKVVELNKEASDG